MKLVTSVTYALEDLDNLDNKYIVKPTTWGLNDLNINSKDSKLKSTFERCINSIEIPLEHIENTNQYILQFNTDLYINDDEPPILGGCKITGSTVHATSLGSKECNKLFKKQLVRQILETIKTLRIKGE